MLKQAQGPKGGAIPQERARIQDIIGTLQKISTSNNYQFDESLFQIVEEDELAEASITEESELSEREKQLQIAEQYVDQMFGHIF
jgi:hypothetical protein